MILHTSGEWVVNPDMPIMGGHRVCVGVHGTDNCIAIWGDSHADDRYESIANATLIAAAPEMLRVLRMVQDEPNFSKVIQAEVDDVIRLTVTEDEE